MVKKLEKIQESLLRITEFTNKRIESDKYSKNEIVMNGLTTVTSLIDKTNKLSSDYSEAEFEILVREINSFIRSFENIFSEFELAVTFNQLMDELYLATN